jgi:hypothetical protein
MRGGGVDGRGGITRSIGCVGRGGMRGGGTVGRGARFSSARIEAGGSTTLNLCRTRGGINDSHIESSASALKLSADLDDSCGARPCVVGCEAVG